jgi:monofunctional biosynthetic peptidoglycan transglycosylase
MKKWMMVFIKLVFIVFILYVCWIVGHILYWRTYPVEQTAFMRLTQKRLMVTHSKVPFRYQWVEATAISDHLKKAVIAAEDAQFASHRGFDTLGLRIAMQKNIRSQRFVAGGSTITQQLAKNLFLSPKKSVLRKIEEAFIVLIMEHLLTKARILTIYLNVVEWGDGLYGAESAARYYYQKPASQLTPKQAAELASMLPNPKFYQHHRQTRKLIQKKTIIQKRMLTARLPK